MVMMLIIGIGGKFLGDCFNQMSQDLNIRELGVMLVVVVALAILSGKVPDMAAGIVSGSGAHYGAGHLSMGSVIGAAMLAGTMAARTVTALATGGTSAVVGGAAAVGGGGQALRAAFESAQQHIGNGVGGNGGSNGRGGIVSGLTTAGRFSGHMASSLIQGVGASAKTGMKGVSTNMQNRMAQTFPGKVASAIRERSHTSSTNAPAKDPVQQSPMTADQARGFHGPESIPDVRAEAQDFINGSRGSEVT